MPWSGENGPAVAVITSRTFSFFDVAAIILGFGLFTQDFFTQQRLVPFVEFFHVAQDAPIGAEVPVRPIFGPVFFIDLAPIALASVTCGDIGRFEAGQNVTRLGQSCWFEELFVEENFIGLFGDLFHDNAQQTETHIGVFISLARDEQQGLVHGHLDKFLTRDAGIIVTYRPRKTSAMGEQVVQGDALFVGRNVGEILADGVFHFEFAHHFQFKDGGPGELFGNRANAGNGLRREGGFGLAVAQSVPFFEYLPFPGHQHASAEIVFLVQFA